MKSIYKKLAFLTLTALTLNACNTGDEGQDVPKRNWTLTWQDEFNGSAGAAPDATKWTYDIGKGPNNDGWGNDELQEYTNHAENVSLDGKGNLLITAIEPIKDHYTSGRIKTKGLFDQKYGRFEARIKTPYGPGLWPAFWMLGSDIDTNEWPQCGEIDIMELQGKRPEVIQGTLHGPGFNGSEKEKGKQAITKYHALTNSRYDADFHVFAVEWDEDKIDYYVDDYLYQRIEKGDIPEGGEWVFDHNFFLLLNVAVGGTFGGNPNSGTVFPQTMTVDYVRVYKAAE